MKPIKNIVTEDGARYTLCPLKKENVEEIIALCNASVGENMYTREELAEAVDSSNRFFYLAVAEDGNIAGYMYFYLEQFQKLPAFGKLSSTVLTGAGLLKEQTVGNLQSIGVKPEYRGTGLALHLMRFGCSTYCGYLPVQL